MTMYAEVFRPGEFLKDELEARNWTQGEFAQIIGRPVRLINEIIAGKRAITPETAVQIGASLGTSAEVWLNLESQYQLSKVPTADNAIQQKAKLYDIFPVKDLIKRGWLGSVSDAAGKIDVASLARELMNFYGITSIDERPQLAHAARKTSYDDVSMLQFSWLFRVKRIAERQVVPKYDRKTFIESLQQLKALLSAPEEIRRVPALLGACGVRFVLVEALPGSKIDGACLWLNNSAPVIAMSARLDRIDNFWFVLRHEIEHLIQEHGKATRSMILDEDISEAETEAEEDVANKAASEFAVSDAELANYLSRVNPYFFSEERVLGFSSRIGVHPGIVVGRLHKKLEKIGYVPNPYKFLRSYLVKVRHLVSQSAPTDGWGNIYPLT